MNFRLKLLYIIPAVGLGGLAFIVFIALHSVEVFSSLKQRELIKDFSMQILETRPQQSSIKYNWVSWLKTNSYIASSKFSAILQDVDGGIIAIHGGRNSEVNAAQATKLSTDLMRADFREPYIIDNELRYIWHRSEISGTSYSLLLVHASPIESMSFYFKSLGIPLIIAFSIILWVSVWLAVILAELYRRLDKQKKLMENDSLHDPLTGLPNRTLFSDRLAHAIEEAECDNDCVAICMLDLNRFKEVNDALGHECGDKLLVEVSNRIKEILREADTVARVGGDEFAIILRHANVEEATNIAERISKSLKSEFLIDSERFHISGSLGISLFPEHGIKADILLKYADITMYYVKNLNYEFAIYNSDQENERSNTLSLFTDLVEAVKNSEFEIYYQPKLDVKLNRVIGLEALLRWNHPVQGMIYPDVFIPLAEQTGLTRDITKWAIKKAVQDQSLLKNKGMDFTVAINLSAHDLDDDSVCDYIESIAKDIVSNPEKIILEITESSMMLSLSTTDKILSKLNDCGYIISIDDFGTGYSSLSNLQRMHIKEIKIDRSFVSDMDRNENNARIVQATIGLAHDLGINVVAEGAESKAVIKLLRALDCNMIQGYEICKPVPLEELILKYGQVKEVRHEETVQNPVSD